MYGYDYYPYDYYPDRVCPTCQGNGYISIDTEKFGLVKIACPNCQVMDYNGDLSNMKGVQNNHVRLRLLLRTRTLRNRPYDRRSRK